MYVEIFNVEAFTIYFDGKQGFCNSNNCLKALKLVTRMSDVFYPKEDMAICRGRFVPKNCRCVHIHTYAKCMPLYVHNVNIYIYIYILFFSVVH